jgi:hypothetical protein
MTSKGDLAVICWSEEELTFVFVLGGIMATSELSRLCRVRRIEGGKENERLDSRRGAIGVTYLLCLHHDQRRV